MSCRFLKKRFLFFIPIAALLTGSGCGRNPGPEPAAKSAQPRSVVILPFTNLTGKAEWDWVSAAMPVAITQCFEGVPGVRVSAAASLAEAHAERANRVLHGYLAPGRGGVTLHTSIEELGQRQIGNTTTRTSSSEPELLGAAAAIAKDIDPRATEPGFKSIAALKRYVSTFAVPPEAAREQLAALVKDEPSAGLAWVALAERQRLAGDARAAVETAEQALAAGQLRPTQKLRLQMLRASLLRDPKANADATAEFARLQTWDLQAQLGAASAASEARLFPQALEFYAKARQLAPERGELWNLIGYAQAHSGDLTAAVESLKKYAEFDKSGANPLDSLGEVNLLHGRFAEAEKYFRECYRKDPGFNNGVALLKAAWTRLLNRDNAGALTLAEEFAAARVKANDPLAPFYKAQWQQLAGAVKEANAAMEALTRDQNRAVAAIASAQLSQWALQAGDRQRAALLSVNARRLAPNAQVAGLAVASHFAALPSASAEEWEQRAEKGFAAPGLDALKRRALVVALLLDRHPDAAVPWLKQLEAETEPSAAGFTQAMLAQALVESGRAKDAAAYLRTWPLLANELPNLNYSLVMPQLLKTRAAAGLR